MKTLDEMVEQDARARFERGPGIGLAWHQVSDISKISQRQHALKRMSWRRRLLGRLGSFIRRSTS